MNLSELNLCIAKLIIHINKDCPYYDPEVENIYISDNKVYMKVPYADYYYVANDEYVWTEDGLV